MKLFSNLKKFDEKNKRLNLIEMSQTVEELDDSKTMENLGQLETVKI